MKLFIDSIMELKKVVPYLEAILNNPTNPSREVDAFISFYAANNLEKLSRIDNIWSEVKRLVYEFDRYDPDVTFEDRLAGFFGTDRALKLTKRCLDFINVMLAAGIKK